MEQNPSCAIDELHTASPKDGKYRAAWEHLVHGDDPSAICHAYTWLGYRVLDGEVKIEDWRRWDSRVANDRIENQACRARWSLSCDAVRFYADILVVGFFPAVPDFHLAEWPGNIQTFAKIAAVHAVHAKVIDRDEGKIAAQYVTRVKEALSSQVLTCLIDCWQAIGVLECTAMPSPDPWFIGEVVKSAERQPHKFHWLQCIKKIEATLPRPMFHT